MSPALEGQTIGKYRILEALGRGGMAQVYRAYHPQLDRYVAIKVLRSDLVEHDEFLARFKREAHAVSGLRHPNIVQVFDFDVQDEQYYMVMELLEGNTLRARLNDYRARGQRMPLPEVTRILSEVLAGLGYAHSEGVIHRDIKPANIMLTKRDLAVITDFGIAQIVGATQYTVSGALMGTLSYMAPEQGFKGQCDARSDIYSLGIVLYEMLTGYTPFDADTPLAILMKHLNDPLPLPSQSDPSLPAALEPIVLKALAKDPDDRYQTAAEMAAALQTAVASGLPDGPRPVLPPPGGVSQAVFSGKARGQIVDKDFAEGDTAIDAVTLPPGAGASTPPVSAFALPAAFAPLEKLADQRPRILLAVFGGLGAIVLANFFAAMLTATGLSVYRYGWAFEIFLLAGFLTGIGWSLRNPWLLTPAIILVGNAFILAYCAITGRWGDWFLWMLEPFFVAAAIMLPNAIHKGGDRAQAALANMSFAALTVLLACLTCSLSLVALVIRTLLFR
jgi:serine/threonine-protein kinase